VKVKNGDKSIVHIKKEGETMRKIKFRGKRIDNGEWIEGDLLSSAFWSLIDGANCCYILDYDKIKYDDFQSIFEVIDDYEVDSKTIGQNTGVKDKNGVEVYEGDIISRSALADWKVIWKITWDDVLLTWIVEKNIEDELLCRFCYDGNFSYESVGEFEVIGNVYDNPKLKREANKNEQRL
jgi:uncharacterized phage protein (TIGR01671 family)